MWERILKFEIRGFSDARRAGKEYALEDYYESMILSEEEYQRLSNKEKQALHVKLGNLLKHFGKNSWDEERKKFHFAMNARAGRGVPSTMLPTEDYQKRPIQQRRNKRQQRRNKEEARQVKEVMERAKTKSRMILDYFKMWENMYNRLPTLTEITNSEGRPLTVDEERTFNEEYAIRTQE